jgi:DNA-binding beta-propeller fold protein YncE
MPPRQQRPIGRDQRRTRAGSGTVSKLRASDGSVIGTFSVGANPQIMGFNEANVWVANFGGNTVSKL